MQLARSPADHRRSTSSFHPSPSSPSGSLVSIIGTSFGNVRAFEFAVVCVCVCACMCVRTTCAKKRVVGIIKIPSDRRGAIVGGRGEEGEWRKREREEATDVKGKGLRRERERRLRSTRRRRLGTIRRCAGKARSRRRLGGRKIEKEAASVTKGQCCQ